MISGWCSPSGPPTLTSAPIWLLLIFLLLHAGGEIEALDGEGDDATSKEVSAGIPLFQEFVEEGVKVVLRIRPLDGSDRLTVGSDARLSITLTDENSGEPLTGLHPLAWIHRREGNFRPNEAQISEMIGQFLGGLLSVRADIDLNRYYLLVLNQDRTISVIDPQVTFSITKLQHLLAIPGRGGDWVIDEIRERLFVTIPEEGQLAVIDLARMKVEKLITFGPTTEPIQVLRTPDNSGIWVGLDGTSGVAHVDPDELVVKTVIPTGRGRHRLAIDTDSRFLCVTNAESGTATIVDLASELPVREVNCGNTPLAVTYGPAADLFYVALINGETVVALDPSDGEIVSRIKCPRGVVDIEVEPEGRFLFLVSPTENSVTIIDSATNSVMGSTGAVQAPDQIVFTGDFAYIHNTRRANVTLINLGRIASGQVVVTELGIGRQPTTAAPRSMSVADMITPTPEGNAVMVANPADKLVYYYVEGMMASMGNFQTYKRIPDGVLVLDRSLRETSPGIYSTYIRPTRSGIHDMPFVLDQPRIKHGFEVEVIAGEGIVQMPVISTVKLENLSPDLRVKPGEEHRLNFRILDQSTGEPVVGLEDVMAMVLLMPGIWQERHLAREVEPGIYQIVQKFPDRGRHGLLISVPSRGASFNDLEMIQIDVYPDVHGRRGPR